MRKSIILLGIASMATAMMTVTACGRKEKEDTYKDGKLEVSVRNLYFSDYQGGDAYLDEIE